MREKDEPAPPFPALAPERGYRDDRRSNETLARGRGARGVREAPGGWSRIGAGEAR